MPMCLRYDVFNFFARCIQRLFIMHGDPANEILPGLWLGNRIASQDTFWLRQHNINAVFNASKDIPFAPGNHSMYRIPVEDNLKEEEIRNMELWSWEIVHKVLNEYNQGNRVLVHCAAGMQRSAAIVAMVLIALYRCKTDDAIKFIKGKRPIAFLGHANFYKSIKGFENALFRMIIEKNMHDKYPILPLPRD